MTAECPQTHINGAYGLLIEREGEGTMREEQKVYCKCGIWEHGSLSDMPEGWSIYAMGWESMTLCKECAKELDDILAKYRAFNDEFKAFTGRDFCA